VLENSKGEYMKRGFVLGVTAAVALFCGALLFGCVKKEVSTNPGIEQLFNTASVLVEQGEYDQSIAAYSEVISLDPNHAEAYKGRGYAYYSKEDYARARTDWEKVLQINPDDAYARDSLEILQGIAAEPVQQTQTADNTQKIEQLFSTADAFLREGEYDKAIAAFSEVISLNPNYARAYTHRGLAYDLKEDLDRAIADYSEAIRLNPNDAVAYNFRGAVYAEKGDYNKAIENYSQTIRINPNDETGVDAYLKRGIAYANKWDYVHARADWEKVLQIDSNNTTARDNLNNLGQRGMAAEPERQAQAANNTQGQGIEQLLNTARSFEANEEYDAAIAAYSEIISLKPTADAYNNRGNAYGRKGDYDRAITDFNQAIRLTPNDTEAYFDRGIAYVMKEDYVRARADWEKVLQLDSGHSQARENLEKLQQMGY
jgi:tetratricopeptide (TPR) repeat protein